MRKKGNYVEIEKLENEKMQVIFAQVKQEIKKRKIGRNKKKSAGEFVGGAEYERRE